MEPDNIIQTVLFQANQIRELTNMKTAMERQIAQSASTIESLRLQLKQANEHPAHQLFRQTAKLPEA